METAQADMESVPTTGALASSYRRTLKDLAKGDATVDVDNPEHFKLRGALKRLGITEMDKRTWKECSIKVSQFVKEERLVWLVPKSVVPDLDKNRRISLWLVGPDEAQGVDRDSLWVLDYHTPPGPYMKGAVRRTIGWRADKDVSSKRPRLEDAGPSAAAAGADNDASLNGGAGPSAAAREAPGGAAAASAASAATQEEKRRMTTLAEHRSNEDGADDSEIKGLRKACEEHCKAGRYYDEDPMDSQTAHFQAHLFVAYLKKEKRVFEEKTPGGNFADVLSVEARYFFQYLASWLSEGDTYKVVEHFAKIFEDAKELHPALVPKVAQAICSIGQFPLLGTFGGGQDALAKFALPPRQIAALSGSAFQKCGRQNLSNVRHGAPGGDVAIFTLHKFEILPPCFALTRHCVVALSPLAWAFHLLTSFNLLSQAAGSRFRFVDRLSGTSNSAVKASTSALATDRDRAAPRRSAAAAWKRSSAARRVEATLAALFMRVEAKAHAKNSCLPGPTWLRAQRAGKAGTQVREHRITSLLLPPTSVDLPTTSASRLFPSAARWSRPHQRERESRRQRTNCPACR